MEKQPRPNIWTYVKELAMVVWGPNKDNGLRSIVTEHETRLDNQGKALDSLVSDLKNYRESGRMMTCYGLAELAKRDKEDIGLRTAGVSARALVIAAVIPSMVSAIASIAVVLITLFGGR